jgi:protein-S-isoprenylcysteine O-methyltransferase Ste14
MRSGGVSKNRRTDMSSAPSTTAPQDALSGRILALAYGLVVYAYFLGIFLYLIGFVGGFGVPKTIDSGAAGVGWQAAVFNILPLGLFAVQHTIMARPAFKRWWIQYLPEPIERSTFVAFTVAILTLLVWNWQALPAVVWQVSGWGSLVLTAISLIGWAIVLISTFLIDHFELFGVKQVIAYATGRPAPRPEFRERLFYRYVRHPLMTGFLIAFWFTPTMTVGHLLFAAVTTAYVLLALIVEEQTLIELHGDAYEDYRKRVPKLFPRLLPR